MWKTLVALNNAIARAKSLHVRYMVEGGIVQHVLPLCHSASTRIRLQALWIIGNLGTSEGEDGFKGIILTPDLVTTIIKVRDDR